MRQAGKLLFSFREGKEGVTACKIQLSMLFAHHLHVLLAQHGGSSISKVRRTWSSEQHDQKGRSVHERLN
jgi:hypothetical protein